MESHLLTISRTEARKIHNWTHAEFLMREIAFRIETRKQKHEYITTHAYLPKLDLCFDDADDAMSSSMYETFDF